MLTPFYIGDDEPGTTVIMGDDHDATFTGSRITDLASYLEFVLAHRGMPEPRRDEFIEWGGHKKARLVFERDDFEANRPNWPTISASMSRLDGSSHSGITLDSGIC